mmetsp:Transcript_39192/g.77092  ORF Transcript_39192/g.77092 Transcript_39192/m.77092 type:complete len:933 (-) Transcript_39192:745-3543(-)
MKVALTATGLFAVSEAALSQVKKHEAEAKHTKWDPKQVDMKTIREMSKELSVDDALMAVKSANVPEDLKEFIQGKRSEESFGPNYTPVAVITKINGIFENAQSELDYTFVTCHDSLIAQQLAMDGLAIDKSHAGAMLEDAIAEKNMWSAEMMASITIRDKLQEELDEFLNQCTLADTQSEALITMISADLAVVKGVIDSNQCKSSDPFKPSTTKVSGTVSPGALNKSTGKSVPSLLQTKSSKTNEEVKSKARAMLQRYRNMQEDAHHGGNRFQPRYHLSKEDQKLVDQTKGMSLIRCSFKDGVSFLSFEDTDTAKAMVQMSNKKFQAFQSHLENLLQASIETAATTPKPAATTPLPSYNAFDIGSNPYAHNQDARDLAKEIRNKQIAGEDVDAEATCSFAGSPLCPSFFEEISQLGGDIDAELTDEKNYRDENNRICEETKKRMELDIEGWDTHIEFCDQHGSALAARIKELKETIRTIEINYKEFLDAYENERTYCEKTIKEHKSAMCGAIRVKTELMRMSSMPNEIWDCEVSPFDATACSRTCEGGSKVWTREVLIKNTPTYGTNCPSLELTTTCNMFACPIPCAVSPFGPWSHCSAECGMGVHYRVRSVVTPPMFGGTACPALQQSADCNAGICDAECELTEWTEFSDCTAYCGGGTQYREKHVKTEAIGDGTCPGKRNPQRYEIVDCNTGTCAPGVPICNTKMDVVLVVDSSGSIGYYNWPEVVKGVSAVAHQMNYANVKLGTVIFSYGTSTYSVLTDDVDEINRLYPGTMQGEWMGSVTNTHMALAHAQHLLIEGGRAAEGAKQTVMLFTDGYPCCQPGARDMTRYAAQDLVGSGVRLIVVPLGNADANFIGEMNSLASSDSTITIPTFEEFVKEETAAALIERMCDDIVMKPVSYKANVVIKDDKLGQVLSTHSTNTAAVTGTPVP